MKIDKYDDSTLDTFDISLLAALQRDAYATHQQLGEQVHLSASQVSRRVARLQAAGIVRRYVALLDPAAIGLGVRAITYVTLTRHSGDEGLAFEREIGSFPEVLECYSVAGESDYILQIVALSISHYQDIIDDLLSREIGISVYFTYVVTKVVKRYEGYPLAELLSHEAKKA